MLNKLISKARKLVTDLKNAVIMDEPPCKTPGEAVDRLMFENAVRRADMGDTRSLN